MGYLKANPSFKLSYWRGGRSGLDGFADSDWGSPDAGGVVCLLTQTPECLGPEETHVLREVAKVYPLDGRLGCCIVLRLCCRYRDGLVQL